MAHRSVVVSVAILAALIISSFTMHIAWNVLDLRLPSLGSVAQAQEQRLQPTQQTDGTLVFTGSGADSQTTEPFEITTSTWTISSESEPSGNNPLISVLTEDGDFIDAPGEFNFRGSDTYSVSAQPGRYYLEISPLVENASYTVTVDQDGASEITQSATASATAAASSTATASSTANASSTASARPTPDDLLDAGGPRYGPVPFLPGGRCPSEYPVKRSDGCYVE